MSDTTSPQRRGYRALISFGLTDNQILELVDTLKEQGIEFREIDRSEIPQPDKAEVWTPHNADYQYKARRIVADYYNEVAVAHRDPTITLGDVYIVWFCKTLQNWKCLLSTSVPDMMYYEITYDGNEKVAYLDAYRKVVNRTVQD